jgi:hypothetical protein
MVREEIDDNEKTIVWFGTRKGKGIWEKGGKEMKVRKGSEMEYSKTSLILTNWERSLVQISESLNYRSATEMC